MTENNQLNGLYWPLLFGIWLCASLSMLGSLFFSEIMKFTPCTLCWYQRISMYPIVLIAFIGLLKTDKHILRYILPLSAIGFVIALYHNLLHWKIIPENAAPCVQGVPCSTVYVQYFGFLTIPLMALIAFGIINILIILLARNLNRE